MKLRHGRSLGLATAITMLLTSSPAVSAGASEWPTGDALIVLAHEYLHDRASRVTGSYSSLSTAPPSMLTTAAATDAFSASMAAETAQLDRLREKFTGTLTEFSHAKVTVEHAETTTTGDLAEVKLTETTDLYLAARSRSADAPTATSYRLGHTLRFSRSDGTWRLSSDVLDLPQYALNPIPYVYAEKSGPAAPDEMPTSPSVPIDMEPTTPDTPRKPRAASEPLAPNAAFNRQAAVRYALDWSHGRNPYYNTFGNDCTNFLSQILWAGGWRNAGGIEGPDKWWHIPPRDSRSWRIADELARFGVLLSQRLRGYSGEPARLGDGIFSDWDDGNGNPVADGDIDHAMFITALLDPWDWEGIFVTYHTTDTKNISMAAVAQKVREQGNPNFGGTYYFVDTR